MGTPLTAAEKIFSQKAGNEVHAGEIAIGEIDCVLLNDISGPLSFSQLEVMGASRVARPETVVLVGDHFAPPKDVASARGLASLAEFAQKHGIKNHFDIGDGGIEHTLLPERGLVKPGDLVVGGDSHTCTAGAFAALGTGMGSSDIAAALALGELWFRVPETMRYTFTGRRQPYVAGKDFILKILGDIGTDGAIGACLEYVGPGIEALDMDDRMAVCNMAVEAGAKTCIVPADDKTKAWAANLADPGTLYYSDDDATFAYDATIDLDELGPLVAQPFSPDNVAPIEHIRNVRVDQVYIGNCANGTLADLRQAASIFRGQRVARNVRCIIVPATSRIYRQAIEEGLIATFLDAGAIVSAPTCGACAGLHNGVLMEGQTSVATTNRNYRGRMGDPRSQVYLANAYVSAAAAIAGELVSPGAVAGKSAA